MTTRLTTQTVTFRRPFVLTGFDDLAPPGDYVVATEEELLDTVSVIAWHRLSTTIRVRCRDGAVETHAVAPDELREALLRDDAQDDPPVAAEGVASPRRFVGGPELQAENRK